MNIKDVQVGIKIPEWAKNMSIFRWIPLRHEVKDNMIDYYVPHEFINLAKEFGITFMYSEEVNYEV